MKHLFVPYKIALELKEKGFNEPCFLSYEEDQELCERSIRSYNHYYTEDEDKFHCSAPLYQQVIDWLEFNHHSDCYTIPVLSKQPKQYESYLLFRGKTTSFGLFNSPQLALNKAIEEALKLI
jgi:hypothetical protein